jgi:DNA-binding transcriptional ArsR family regulator
MNSSQRLDAIFAALADPTRRAILARLTAGETSVLDLVRPFRMSQPAISKHLQVLERAGLVSQARRGQQRPRKLEPQILAMIDAWLDPYRPYWKLNLKPALGAHP